MSTSRVWTCETDAEGGYIVSGSFDLDHLHDLVEFRKPEDAESTTVGGLVTEWLGHVPEAGETIERDGVRIEVLAANELRVDQVRISKLEPQAGAWRIRRSDSSPASCRIIGRPERREIHAAECAGRQQGRDRRR